MNVVDKRPPAPMHHRAEPADRQWRKAQRRLWYRRPRVSEALWGWLFVGPMVIGVAIFYFWPILRSAYLSFTASGPFGGNKWSGLANYRGMLSDSEFWLALRNSFVFTAIVLLGIPVAVVVAALINRRGLRLKGVYRALYFLPVVTMPTAVALVWKAMYNGQYGIVNRILSAVGLPQHNWLVDPHYALYAMAVVSVWSGLGTQIVIFSAALQDIPPELYEAAECDGAGWYRQLRSVTVPLLTPSIFFVLIISVIQSLQAFDLVFVLLGPNNPATPQAETIVYYFYDRTFLQHEPGMGSAVAIALMLILLALTGWQFRLQRRWVHYA